MTGRQLGVALLLIGVACTPRRVDTLPGRCRSGTVVITGQQCQSRCTCDSDGKWRCISQPCAQVAPRSPDAGPLRGSLTPAPDAQAATSLPDSRPARPAVTERIEGAWRRSFNADGSLRAQDFHHLGRPALRCLPRPVEGELTCRPSFARTAVVLPASCWSGARLPRAAVHVLGAPADFERVFRCRPVPDLDWPNARLVLVQAGVAPAEKLELEVRLRRGATELIARIVSRCSGVRQFPPAPVVQRRELFALPRDGSALSGRIERLPAQCEQVP